MPKAGIAALTNEELDERRQRAIELRRAGRTYHEIGKELGVTGAQARSDIYRYLEIHSQHFTESIDEVRIIETMRLDRLTQILFERPELDNESIVTMLRIMNHRSRLLGLEAPRRTMITVNNSEQDLKLTPEQIVDRMTELQNRLAEMRRDSVLLEAGTRADIEAEIVPEVVLAKPANSEKE